MSPSPAPCLRRLRAGSLFFCLIPALLGAEPPSPAPPSLEFSLDLGPLFDLEGSPVGVRLGCGLRSPRLPLLPALRLGLTGDRALSSVFLEGGLELGTGKGLAGSLGLLQALGRPSLALGPSESLLLEADRPLLRLGCEALLLRRALGERTELQLLAALTWGTLLARERDGSAEAPGLASDEALRLFAAGFRGRLGLRLLFPRGP